jgi:hypothetical protein
MQHYRKDRRGRGFLLLTAAGLGFSAVATLALADSTPESIRIQERAEKAYETAPVVPIDRGNAHHRDSEKDDGAGTDGASGGAYVPSPSDGEAPRTSVRHDTTK